MPVGTKVDNIYRALLKKGYTQSQAAKVAQANTGMALRTGKPLKSKGEYSGQKNGNSRKRRTT